MPAHTSFQGPERCPRLAQAAAGGIEEEERVRLFPSRRAFLGTTPSSLVLHRQPADRRVERMRGSSAPMRRRRSEAALCGAARARLATFAQTARSSTSSGKTSKGSSLAKLRVGRDDEPPVTEEAATSPAAGRCCTGAPAHVALHRHRGGDRLAATHASSLDTTILLLVGKRVFRHHAEAGILASPVNAQIERLQQLGNLLIDSQRLGPRSFARAARAQAHSCLIEGSAAPPP